MCLILAVIVLAGIFGGVVNFYLAKPDDVPPPTLVRSIVVGVAASFLVPLFLNMISSNLIDLITGGDNSRLLILAGFCLVAAISSTAFIRTLSDRVLTEARQAKREATAAKTEVAEVKQEIEPIVAKETESEQPGANGRFGQEPATNEQKLLRALSGGRWALRSEGGLAKEIGVERGDVAKLLQELHSRGLVGRRAGERGTRWFITAAGRTAL